MADNYLTTAEVVERYFSAVNAGDWNEWLTLFADDVVLIEPIGTIEGLENLRNGVGVLTKVYSSFQNNLLSYFVNGEHAAAQTHISAVTASGGKIEVDVCNTYTIRNGKISHQKNYLDSKELQPFLDELKKQGY
ncbi:nuclear transport factor 2 family protein [Chitinibacter sp. GC72]|uniref:nuclear transport factor 2 family protein n=1 Tax=Chitinibacter sp. GC72 TaxID=1526917 RepID=UPI0012FB18FC|nr:nuclear transport factor 2 family protein [Chitinibacter sp. GC72]